MRATLLCLFLATWTAFFLPAASADDTGLEFFEKRIRPVLAQRCYACHSVDAQKHKGGLLLDSREAIRKGGDLGPAIVPGKPEESLLLKAVRQTSADLKMPPKEKLADAVIADLEAWVRMGAPDPRERSDALPPRANWEELLKDRRKWWSLQPVRKPDVPAVGDATCSDQPVDRFLLARLEAAHLQPAGPADRRTLIRRLSLVLTGLPPSPEEVDGYLRDASPDAYEKLVDRLLASPHFGERWARHWLDVVRFSETHGNEWNYEVHHAWRYRDYLIRAFNDDVPFDQLIREHIAGDLLPEPRRNRLDGSAESVIGTAFYRFGEVNHDDCIALPQIGFDIADNQIDTLSKAFQATTIACARCHDHKLDAVSMRDYYGLLGILRSSRLVSHTIDADTVNRGPMQRLRELKGAMRAELSEEWLRAARGIGRYLLAAQERLGGRDSHGSPVEQDLDTARLDKWAAALKADKPPLEDPLSPWRLAAATSEMDFATEWARLAERYSAEDRARVDFNRRFATLADFRTGMPAGWQAAGQGLRDGPARSGECTISHDGDALLTAVLPAGCFTHTLSEKLNGALRSPLLTQSGKHISFEVLGRRSSAVRLVSNNCQLNYKNYKALTSSQLQWVTFVLPDSSPGLRVYAELMTMFDNPKFPDQLSALGGDPANYRLPWEQAAANPRSYFGVTRVVLHDGPEPPKPELSHMRRLFAGSESTGSLKALAERYAAVVEAAVRAWEADRAADDDVIWLGSLLQRGLLGNSIHLTPRLEALAGQYRAAEKELALPRIVPGVADYDAGFDQPLLARGDCTRPAERVRRGYLEVLSAPGRCFTPSGSGRLELAGRIASSENPLTARVLVNRVWHHLFGAGIVRTVDDFGRIGDQPSHPELLDYLAARFVEEGWSVKRLIRSLVLTRAFRMANVPAPAVREVDPQNRLLQHYPARRMEAEAIRDAILAASGRLDRTLYGPSIASFREQSNADRRLFPGPLDGHGRRSVYIKSALMEGPKFLAAFDLPGGKVAQGRRDVTNVPAQALALLNDPFVHQQAGVWAERLVARRDASVAGRIDHMFQVALGRPPRQDERKRFELEAELVADLHGVAERDILASAPVWKDLAHVMFNLKEFIYIP